MSRPRRSFLLREAVSLLPVVRPLLVAIRRERSAIHRLERQWQRAVAVGTGDEELLRRLLECRRAHAEYLRFARFLGVMVTPGVRCEALFPFHHRWTGAGGDGRLRPAYFVFGDAQSTIREWFFAGAPHDRRPAPREWRRVRRDSLSR